MNQELSHIWFITYSFYSFWAKLNIRKQNIRGWHLFDTFEKCAGDAHPMCRVFKVPLSMHDVFVLSGNVFCTILYYEYKWKNWLERGTFLFSLCPPPPQSQQEFANRYTSVIVLIGWMKCLTEVAVKYYLVLSASWYLNKSFCYRLFVKRIHLKI